MGKRWRVCLDCGTEWEDAEVGGNAGFGARPCPDCGGPMVPTDPERAAACRLYTSRKRDVAALIDWLELELGHHTEYAAKEGLSHSHAGDLGHVRELLVQTLAFLAQRDEKDIEDALADAAAGREQAQGETTD